MIEDGETLATGSYVAETFPVHIEDSYVIGETWQPTSSAEFELACSDRPHFEAAVQL